MATLLKTYYGNTVNPGTNSFRIVAKLYCKDVDSSKGYNLQVKYYVQVLDGQNEPFSEHFKVSWDDIEYKLSTAKNYATTTEDLDWVKAGDSQNITASGSYSVDLGNNQYRTYESSINATYTIPSVTVKFNKNSGDGAPSDVTGAPRAIKIPSKKPTRDGYTFDGWVAQKTRSGSTNGGLFIEKPNSNFLNYFQITRLSPDTLEVLASAKNLDSMKIGVWTDAGDGTDNKDDRQWYDMESDTWKKYDKSFNFGTEVNISNHIIFNSYKDLINYYVNIYGVSSSNSNQVALHLPDDPYIDVEFFPGDTYNYDFDVTLYAQWAANTYTIKYYANGGSGSMEDTIVTYDTETQTRDNDFVKSGYKFKGWTMYRTSDNKWQYTLSDESNGFYVEGSNPSGSAKTVYKNGFISKTASPVNGDIVKLYAQWEANKYKLVLLNNDGSSEYTSVEVTYDSDECADLSSVIPNRLGYKFLGWFVDNTAESMVYDENGKCVNDGIYFKNNCYKYDDGVSLLAHWEPLNIAYQKVSGTYKLCFTYYKKDGEWKKAILYKRINNTYERSIVNE